jgi:hypothetical protein
MTAPRAMTTALIGLPTKESGRDSFLAASAPLRCEAGRLAEGRRRASVTDS